MERGIVPYFFYGKKGEANMVKSQITGKVYVESSAIYISNMLQAQRYLAYLGPEYLLDVLYSGTRKKDSLVFVFQKCPETRKAKELWDNHELG